MKAKDCAENVIHNTDRRCVELHKIGNSRDSEKIAIARPKIQSHPHGHR